MNVVFAGTHDGMKRRTRAHQGAVPSTQLKHARKDLHRLACGTALLAGVLPSAAFSKPYGTRRGCWCFMRLHYLARGTACPTSYNNSRDCMYCW